MGIYYFAVDYGAEEQMWAPKRFADKSPGIYHPKHPLPHMIIMKNIQGSHFEIVNDMSTEREHSFKNVTVEVFEEYKKQFPEHKWEDDIH